jgi:hypothetical protein
VSYGHHVDAIHRARGKAQSTACTLGCDDGVHLFRGSDNGIDWTGLDTQCTAYAMSLVDERHAFFPVYAVLLIQRFRITAQECGQGANGGFSPGWALVYLRLAGDNGFGIGSTASEAALSALGLRKQCIHPVCDRIAFDSVAYGGITQQQSQKGSQQTDGENCA